MPPTAGARSNIVNVSMPASRSLIAMQIPPGPAPMMPMRRVLDVACSPFDIGRLFLSGRGQWLVDDLRAVAAHAGERGQAGTGGGETAHQHRDARVGDLGDRRSR